jgi:PAS domain S-box-containing protein
MAEADPDARGDDALRESEARYRALADATLEGVTIHEHGRMIDANEAFVRMFGYTREELVGAPPFVIVTPESREVAHALVERGAEGTWELTALHKDGTTFPIEVRARSCSYQGRPARVALLRDLRDQRRVEAERRAIEARLVQADRLAALGTLAAGVAHEINNPLSYVIANVRLVADRLRAGAVDRGAEDLAAALTALDEAREGAERVQGIVRDLKTFALADDTTQAGQRAGLGLSVCHGVVTALGGRIEDEISSAGGTSFRVVLPAADPVPVSVPPPAPESPRSPSAAPAAGRILIVDDEAMVGRVVERALGRDHRVAAVTSGRAALARIEQGERYDVVLCDLMMPEMTGMELHERVAAIDPDQADRMVFLSGGAFTPRARAFLEHRPCLEKPFDLATLEAVIRERLGA